MKKILIANRGEIAIRIIRACHELHLKTVAIYAKEDEYGVHRFRADEAYLVGAGKKPIDAYLDMDDIIRIAKMTGADAIHPGYGFLSENEEFAQNVKMQALYLSGQRLSSSKCSATRLRQKKLLMLQGLKPFRALKIR